MVEKYRFDGKKIKLDESQWKQNLPYQEFCIMRKKGTEPAFDNEYHDHYAPGIYLCAACQLPLFTSNAKFDSGTGWPSFFAPIFPENVTMHADGGRLEVLCSRCDSHLGHVFDDGPNPTGKRFCMNSAALKFIPKAL